MTVSTALMAAADQPSTRASTGVPARSAITPLMASWNPVRSSSLRGRTITIGPCSFARGSVTHHNLLLPFLHLTTTVSSVILIIDEILSIITLP